MTVRRPEAARVISAREVCNELRSVIRYNGTGESVELPDVVQEESCCTLGRDDGVGCHEVCLLGPEVDYVHDHVVAMGIREFADKVDAYDVPRHVQNGHWVKFAIGSMPQRLCVTAQIASLRVQTDFPAKAGPPVASRNQFEGFELPQVSRDARIVMLLNNLSPKVFVFGDVDLAAKEEEVVFEGPFCTLN